MQVSRWPLLGLGLGVLLLGGCKSLSCSNPDAYTKAQEVPPLKMPVGLDGPDTSKALGIPALNEPEAPRDPGGPCLEDPPILDTSVATPGAQPVYPDAVRPAPPAKRTRPISPPQ